MTSCRIGLKNKIHETGVDGRPLLAVELWPTHRRASPLDGTGLDRLTNHHRASTVHVYTVQYSSNNSDFTSQYERLQYVTTHLLLLLHESELYK